MKIYVKILLLAGCWMLLLCIQASAQDSTGLYNRLLHDPDRLFQKVNDRSADLSTRLTKQTGKYLKSLARQETKLQKKLAGKDSLAASHIFGDVQQQYAMLQAKMNSVSPKASHIQGTYLPHLDSLKSVLEFLSQSKELGGSKAVEVQSKLRDALGSADKLQDKFTQAEDVKKFIEQRKRVLQEQLGRYNLGTELKRYQKQVYYYQAQVDSYKRMLNDPSKIEAKALEMLKEMPRFRYFFSKNSQLASLFRIPGSSPGTGSSANFAGLQTRVSVQQELQRQFGSGANVQQLMAQQVQGAQSQLDQLKEKVIKRGLGNSDEQMPDFKPNTQKTKNFMKRLEVGGNLQTMKSNRFFPSTTDVGLSVGYKLNDKSTIGVGGSYKMGWGKDIRHISISHQGIGVRTFVDYQLKGSLWLSGGGEMNYRSLFSSFEVLNSYSAWQKSALLGLSKKYQVSKKVKGNMQLLYDALWKQQVPRTQPVLFRVGYKLN